MNNIICPHPIELQEKLGRLGWAGWIPTPDVTDEDRELYISLSGQHTHLMSVQEALALSDGELQRRIEAAIGMTYAEACGLHGVDPDTLPAQYPYTGGDEA